MKLYGTLSHTPTTMTDFAETGLYLMQKMLLILPLRFSGCPASSLSDLRSLLKYPVTAAAVAARQLC